MVTRAVTMHDLRAAAPFHLRQVDPRTIHVCDPLPNGAAGPVRVLGELARTVRRRPTRPHEYARQAARGRPYNPSTTEDVWEVRTPGGIIGRHTDLHVAADQAARWIRSRGRAPMPRTWPR